MKATLTNVLALNIIGMKLEHLCIRTLGRLEIEIAGEQLIANVCVHGANMI